jgi:hypothetical protein
MFAYLILASTAFCAPIDLQVGPRPQGMGAFVAVCDDANALYWNPAGLVQLRSVQTIFVHTRPFQIDDLSLEFVGFCQPLGVRGGVGVSWLRCSANLYEGEDFNSSKMVENIYTFSSAFMLERVPLSIGANIKRIDIRSRLGGAAGFGFDIGLLWRGERICAGAMLRNIGTDIKNEPVPTIIRSGIALMLWEGRVRVCADILMKKQVNNEEKDKRVVIGLEQLIGKNLAIRAGIDNKKNVSFGAGFKIKGCQIDYAFCNNHGYDLGHTNWYSIIFRF